MQSFPLGGSDIHLPFTLGAEDALAFRLPPHQSGAPLRWFRQLYNLDGRYITKDSIKTKINSGDWSTALPEELLEERYEIARYNTHSRNVHDMIDQKNLWIKMHKATIGYDPTGFRVSGLSHSSLQHHGNMTAKCLQYLQQASAPVHADAGIWRLWEDPQDVPQSVGNPRRSPGSQPQS